MLDQSHHTAQDALDLINAGEAPLDFATGIAVYRAAVKRMAKMNIPGLMTDDLSAIPMTLSFVDMFCDRLKLQTPTSKKERNARSQLKIRLRTIARRLEGVPVVRTTNGWDTFLDAVRKLAVSRELGEQTLIPVGRCCRTHA